MNSDEIINDIEKAFTLASRHFQARRLSEAENIYNQILLKFPDHPRALHGLGVIRFHSGMGESAVALIRQAISFNSNFPDAYNNLGNVLKELGRLDESIESYSYAIALKPDFAMALSNLGNTFRDIGKFDDAITCLQRALAINTDNPDILNDLGNVLMDQGKLDEAIAYFKKTLAISPDSAAAHNNLGNALMDQGKLDKAISCFQIAIALEPAYANAYNNLGVALAKQGRLDEAASSYRKSLELNPDYALAYNNLGSAYRDMGRLDEAVASYTKAITIRTEYHEAYNNLAVILAEQGKLAEAFEHYRKSLAIKPDYAPAHSNLIFAMNYSPAVTSEEIFEESCRWNKMHAGPNTARSVTHCNDPSPRRRLRIGYVSPDFREHSVSYFFEPLVANHDRDKIEVHCYSDVINPDKTTRRLKRLADSWLNCIDLTDEALADRISHDRIDILIDLAGHTAHNRLTVFAKKPTPVQVTWLGYPNTTGLSTMDYRLTDAVVDPEGTSDSLHSEKLYRLPESFLCYKPPTRYPRVLPLPAYENGFVTFGSFNNLTKMTPEVIDLWGEILRLVTGSRLVLKNKALADPSTLSRYRQMFADNGIDPERVGLLSYEPSTKGHLALYNRVDIALDPFPYNGTTTTCEALWMGVPVIILRGDRHAGRVGASILHNVGLNDLVAKTTDEYLNIARNLAKDRRKLADLRRKLRKRMAGSPLCNAGEFTKHVEEAYRCMWHAWCSETNGASTSEETNLEPRQT